MARIRTKRECIELLFSTLQREAPARSLAEAHELVATRLDEIEDKYSGEEKNYSGNRMYFWSLDSGFWERAEEDAMKIGLNGGYTAYLFADGSIRIDRHAKCGTVWTVFEHRGAGTAGNDQGGRRGEA